MKNVRIGIIGCGARARSIYVNGMKDNANAEIVALCDGNLQNAEALARMILNDGRAYPCLYSDYRQLIEKEKPDAVIIATPWRLHSEISVFAMEAGICAACEVGSSYSEEELWRVVDCFEHTKIPFMFLENCCFAQTELMTLKMKRQGLLGEIVHCEGGYRHDLRKMALGSKELGGYRLNEYRQRNCDNYPTHGLGAIAKIIGINCGNTFTSIRSLSSKAVGLNDFTKRNNGCCCSPDEKFMQGDVFVSLISCARGESVTLTLDTTLPRFYSRDFCVQGTRGLVDERSNSVFLDEKYSEQQQLNWHENFNNLDVYKKDYAHPLWKNRNVEDGHRAADGIMIDRFINCLCEKKPMPTDVYDYATWSAVSYLSERSAANGGTCVAFPDFTRGAWAKRQDDFLKEYDGL